MTVVCVLGAPRSGTSLTTRILNLLGVDLGPEENLRWPVPESPLWECRQIVDLNERILERLGGEGLAPPLPEPGWERSAELDEERAAARELLDELFAASPLWGWKDPRTCLTLPFWQQLVPDMRYVVCLRNPLDAVASILRHVPIGQEQALRTWLAYAGSALVNTSGAQRVFVSYEAYFSELEPQVARLVEAAGLPEPAADAPGRREIESLVKERMWHFRGTGEEGFDDPQLTHAVTPLYLMLELMRAGAGTMDGAARASSEELSMAVDRYAARVLADLPRIEPALEGGAA